MRLSVASAVIWFFCLWSLLPAESEAADAPDESVQAVVAQAIAPVMKQYGIPGMAVGVILNGRHYVFNFGVASKATGQPVDDDTLFEIGSISKTFNATLASYAQLKGDFSLSGNASQYLAALRGGAFDKVTLIDLGTYTPGGMQMQVPDGIDNHMELMAYYKAWKPAFQPGTMRTYSNLSIGLLGFITAKAMKTDYAALVQSRMFPALGLKHSYLNVPTREMANYAQGYEDDGTPIRLKEDVLTPETGGVRTTASDLLRFLDINVGAVRVDGAWQTAATATHTGYFQTTAGGMVQDLVWEQYALPVTLAALQAGNSYGMIMDPHPVTAILPPLPPHPNVLLDKTGSTNGFGAYVAYVPSERIGVVLLANRDYPIPARVSAAFEILTRLDGGVGAD